ncbi:hypothetical protein MKW94_030362 [Papaver nudicaule]|uniref:Uncharacterized protein n=1 Tax=Papaver nudicaule TaxID=74823 RepID=A0AA42B429_PAPNU|nr:hypothetical protein [Papaver nudicaule]
MEGGGRSLMRMIAMVLFVVGMFIGKISASSGPVLDFAVCFNPCYNDCMSPNPKSTYLSRTCTSKCVPLCAKKPEDFEVCFNPSYDECMKPNPESEDLSITCIAKCVPPCLKLSPLDSHRKSLAN